MKRLTQAQIKQELESQMRDCVCRKCGATYRALGGNLCAKDECRKAAGLLTLSEQAAKDAASDAAIRERERAARTERRARERGEWKEAV